MKTLGTILLASALVLGTSTAFAQVKLGGHGSAGISSRGSAGGLSTKGFGRFGAHGRGGAHLGLGGHGRAGSFSGIGNSRVNSAISGQNRMRGGGRRR